VRAVNRRFTLVRHGAAMPDFVQISALRSVLSDIDPVLALACVLSVAAGVALLIRAVRRGRRRAAPASAARLARVTRSADERDGRDDAAEPPRGRPKLVAEGGARRWWKGRTSGTECRWRRDPKAGEVRLKRWTCDACGVEAYTAGRGRPKDCKRAFKSSGL